MGLWKLYLQNILTYIKCVYIQLKTKRKPVQYTLPQVSDILIQLLVTNVFALPTVCDRERLLALIYK